MDEVVHFIEKAGNALNLAGNLVPCHGQSIPNGEASSDEKAMPYDEKKEACGLEFVEHDSRTVSPYLGKGESNAYLSPTSTHTLALQTPQQLQNWEKKCAYVYYHRRGEDESQNTLVKLVSDVLGFRFFSYSVPSKFGRSATKGAGDRVDLRNGPFSAFLTQISTILLSPLNKTAQLEPNF